MKATDSPLTVVCPFCHAAKGSPCVDGHGEKEPRMRDEAHQARARRWDETAAKAKPNLASWRDLSTGEIRRELMRRRQKSEVTR